MNRSSNAALFLAAILSGCSVELPPLTGSQLSCEKDADCPGELRCLAPAGRCVDPSAPCVELRSDGLAPAADGNACTLADGSRGLCIDASCQASRCGDGVVDPEAAELCDDGAANDDHLPNACRTDCQPARCGDGTLDAEESCDDGNRAEDDACLNTCERARCGDGFVFAGQEECDDGNGADDDACLSTCVAASCGDGVRRLGVEACDDANENPNDGCDLCSLATWRGEATILSGLGRDANALQRAFGQPILALTTDPAGRIYFSSENMIYRYTPSAEGGLIARLAGGGRLLEDAFASEAGLRGVLALAADAHGNVFFTEGNASARRVRVVRPDGRVVNYAGNGHACQAGSDCGDGGPALSAELSPGALELDRQGGLLIVDGGVRVRRVDPVTGEIETLAGTGDYCDGTGGTMPSCSLASSPCGDGGPATAARFRSIADLALDGQGNLYLADRCANRVRRIDTSGIVETVAGNGQYAYGSAADGLATSQILADPWTVEVDDGGRILVGQMNASRIRSLDLATGLISTVAGTGASCDGTSGCGDGGPAVQAQLPQPRKIVRGPDGIYVVFNVLPRVRRFRPGGDIDTVVGSRGVGLAPDGVPGTSLRVRTSALDAAPTGGDLAFLDGLRVLAYRSASGTIEHVAGTGLPCTDLAGGCGDGGDARSAQIGTFTGGSVPTPPTAVAVASDGAIFLADAGYRIRRIGPDGVISTVAGTGERCSAVPVSGCDHASATSARLVTVSRLAVVSSQLYMVDGSTLRRMALPSGPLTTIAGTGGAPNYTQPLANGTIATAATLRCPSDVAAAGDGTVYFADLDFCSIFRISAGRIYNVVNESSWCAPDDRSGCGEFLQGAPAGATLAQPHSLAVDSSGRVVFADWARKSVRRVDGTGGTVTVVAGVPGTSANPAVGPFPRDGGPGTSSHVYPNAGSVAADANGNVYFEDHGSDGSTSLAIVDYRVRKVDSSGVVTTLIGEVDGLGLGIGEESQLLNPTAALWLDGERLLIAEGAAGRLRLYDHGTKRLTTVAGYPHGYDDGEDPAAPSPKAVRARFARLFDHAAGLAFDPAARVVYVSESESHVLRRIDVSGDPATWTIETFAGQRFTRGSADGTLAQARFNGPQGLHFDPSTGALYVADSGNGAVRRIATATGEVQTVAGTGSFGFSGDGGEARAAQLAYPTAVAVGPDGSLYVADTYNDRVRRIEPASGTISTVLGGGGLDPLAAGSPARTLAVPRPRGLTHDRFGNLFVSSEGRIRVVGAGADGAVDGLGHSEVVFGVAPAGSLAEELTGCPSAMLTRGDAGLLFVDACRGLLVELQRD